MIYEGRGARTFTLSRRFSGECYTYLSSLEEAGVWLVWPPMKGAAAIAGVDLIDDSSQLLLLTLPSWITRREKITLALFQRPDVAEVDTHADKTHRSFFAPHLSPQVTMQLEEVRGVLA